MAVTILKATLEAPFHGTQVLEEYRRLGQAFIAKATPRYQGIFPPEGPDTQILGYLFARTIRCPYCGGLIPLSPNWKLAPDGTGVRLVPRTEEDETRRVCDFEIVGKAKDQSEGTVSGGRATCPFPDCGRVIDGNQVKAIAQAGGMGEQLFAVVYKKRVETTTKTGKIREKWERGYRAPRPEDDVFDEIKVRLAEKLPEWEALDIVPNEAFPPDSNDDRPIQYGMPLWRDLFSPRQLYCHGTSVEVFRELLAEEQTKPGFGETQKAAFAYLAIALDTMLNYGTRSCRWDTATQRVRSLFDRHDFAFVWSYSEMAPLITGLGYDWAFDKTEKCIAELIGLLRPDVDAKALKTQKTSKNGVTQEGLFAASSFTPPPLTLSCASGDALTHIEDASIDAVVMDPPYYDNVMYAELSDFFYVWLKRTAAYLYPDLFTRRLTDKENEAVANPARFSGQPKPKELASAEYRSRMAAVFAECRRTLKPDGVLLLMFTHKATGAWDALAKGLLDAGFLISASWPVNTEAEGSLHIKDKAAANSTIFLVCRPRPEKTGETLFWEDLEPLVRQAVLRRVEEFQQAGISGIDLYLASFGPALETFSSHWPVRRGTPRAEPAGKSGQKSLLDESFDPYAATPEDVLETARSAVKDWAIRRILQTGRKSELDPLTEWFVLAWHTFQAPQFAFDEALNLARVVGLNMEGEIIGVIADKKAGDVVIRDSAARASRASLGPAGGTRSMLDALHHAANLARTRNLTAAKEMLLQHALDKNPAFLDALRAVLEVLPVSRKFSGFDPTEAALPSASDFEMLEYLRQQMFGEQVKKPRQLELFG